MKATEVRHLDLGSRLTLTFAFLILLIVGGNGLLIWQFFQARIQSDRLAGVSQQLIAAFRLQESLLLFHQQLDGIVRSEDAHRLATDAEPLRGKLLEETRKTRDALTHLQSETPLDPAVLATLDAIEITLPRQLKTITDLGYSGDWNAVRLRLGNELKPLETQTAVLVNDMNQEVNNELTRSVERMRGVQRRIFLIVPTTAICTFLTAAFFGWAITRRIVELRMQERIGERTRIIRELHDTFLQTIEGSKLVADDALRRPDDAERMLHAMRQLSAWLGQATQEGRAALNSLRVSTIERNDLAEAFGRALEECRMRSSMLASLSVVGVASEMHPIMRDEVYRIGYEAIRNAYTHSNGKHIRVDLSYANDLMVCVTDDGVGIDPAIAKSGKEGHFGLHGMRERALRIGGTLTVETSPASGTRVKLRIPGRNIFGGTRSNWFSIVLAKR